MGRRYIQRGICGVGSIRRILNMGGCRTKSSHYEIVPLSVVLVINSDIYASILLRKLHRVFYEV